jgi:hypothetical protein
MTEEDFGEENWHVTASKIRERNSKLFDSKFRLNF